MAVATRKFTWALVAVLTLLTALVVAPFAPATTADAQTVIVENQFSRVGEPINLAVNWPATAEVVGLPPGLNFANGAVSGTVLVKGRWPVEVRQALTTDFFQWIVTDGPPPGVVAEHPAVDPNAVSPRPVEGTDGVVWDRFNSDTTASLDVTVWDMQQVGSYMYVGGEFKEVIESETERETRQPHLARFSIATGKWDPTFRPVLDGNVHALELNSRGRLLVGGEFTNIDGLPNTQGLAAINPATGQVDSSFEAWVERPFYPQGRAIIRELEVVGDFLYIGGNFSHINGAGGTRTRVNKAARVTANFGSIDPTWAPVISGGSVWGIGVDQQRGRVHLSGRFSSANGDVANSEYVVVTTETGATVQGLADRPINAESQVDMYDVEYAAGQVWVAGSQHFVAGLDADTHQVDFWQFAGNNCTSVFCWSSSGVGGDFQFVEKVGNFVFAGCHCNDRFDRNGRPNHYSSVTNRRTTHSVSMAYELDGTPSDTQFDIGGNVDGGWTVATDDVGCIWLGGDIIDGGFYEPGGRVFARGFARFCGETPIPATPQGLEVTSADADRVTIEWEEAAGATGYRIFRDGVEVGSVDSGSFTRWTDNNVTLGASYLYEVRSENRVGALSPPVSVTAVVGFVDDEAPTVPSNVVAIDGGDGSVTLSWDASIDNAGVLSYLVYRDGVYIGFAPGDETTFVDTPPSEGVTYLYDLRAVDINDNRSEKSTPAVSITLGGEDVEPPTVPQNLAASDDGDGSVELTWDASVDNVAIQSYLIYRDRAYIGFSPAGETSFVATPPAASVSYLYEVRAVDVNDNRSAKTDPGVNFRLGGEDVEPPSDPANVVGVDVGDGSVQISWDASVDNVGVQSYLVYRDGAYVGFTPDGVTTFTEVPPAQGVAYLYEVRAVDVNDNRSEKSSPGASVTIGGEDVEPPSTPANLALINPTAGATEIIWDPSLDNVGVQSYLVYRNGAYVGWTPGDVTTFVDATSVAGESYDYEVRAVDINDNRSDKSLPLTVDVI